MFTPLAAAPGPAVGSPMAHSLCHHPEDVTLLSIIEAIEGPVQVALCCEDETKVNHDEEPCVACQVLSKCPILGPMQRFDHLVRDFLGQVTLQTLMTQETPVSMTFEGVGT